MDNFSAVITGIILVALIIATPEKPKYFENGNNPTTVPVPDTIKELKKENLEKIDSLKKPRKEIQVIKEEVLRKEEMMYIRCCGEVEEIKVKRDPKLQKFIIDVDSLHKQHTK